MNEFIKQVGEKRENARLPSILSLFATNYILIIQEHECWILFIICL